MNNETLNYSTTGMLTGVLHLCNQGGWGLNQKNSSYVDTKSLDETSKKYDTSLMQKKLHLVTAVLHKIRNFHSASLNFSAHDITLAIREAVRDSYFEITDVEALDEFDGQTVPVIVHNDVRAIVKELFEENFIPDYKAGYGKVPSGATYVEYQYQNNDNPATAPLIQADDAGVVTTMQNTTVSNYAEWQHKVEAYLRNQGNPVTAKQIQSRLKGYDVTCQEIVDEAAKQGYKLYAPARFHNGKPNVSETYIGLA